MGLAEDFERRLERVVDGVLSKAFRSDVAPAEIGRRLMREMESDKNISVGAVYVPNVYLVRLSADDHQRLEGLLPTLDKEFVKLLKENSVERRWRPAGPIEVSFELDESLQRGRFEVDVRHEALTEGEPDATVEHAYLRYTSDPEKRFALSGSRVSVGRTKGSDIELVDTEVSRVHAELVQREGVWWVVDLGSSNGTYVNGNVVKERRLEQGDVLRVGSTSLIFDNTGSEG
ncbi:MAG: FhaA domain-containing protein [Actinomycetota bacterium]|nr:DUF3662 and FHA domain-containing protein [Actinomycetota bacterium]